MPREEPMINVQDIHFRYDPEQPSYAVDGVSLAITAASSWLCWGPTAAANPR